MNRFSLADVRRVLENEDFFSIEKLSHMSDEQLCQAKFKEDLAMDSLDFLLFIQKLEGDGKLSVVDPCIWSCRTVQDLLNLT